MFTPRHIKESKMLLKGVTKFIHYKRDILSEEKLGEIKEKQTAFRDLIKTGEKEDIREQAKELQKVCERSLPMPSHPGLRENVEVFFVAIVIALGIRSYFLQPFKIPTGSMQPTLNGIIAYGFDENKGSVAVADEGTAEEAVAGPKPEWGDVEPNIIKKGWELFWNGRNYVDLVAEEDFVVTNLYQKNPFKFFSFTYVERRTPEGGEMKPLKIWAPLDKAMEYPESGGLGLGQGLGLRRDQVIGLVRNAQANNRAAPRVRPPEQLVRSGTVLARGHVDTGDQVLVNKFSYHFRPPKRGEVFVFTTQEITMITNQSPNRQSQHYIKRLCAVPGDAFEIREPELFINGQRATEPGMVRVMNREGCYAGTGYRRYPQQRRFNEGALAEKEYLALGDNSAHSWDSRAWGPVPEKNLVGPALFVYWPFGQHWGLIE